MFFYASLFIACVISAFSVLYLYHALEDVGKAVYRAFLPSKKDNLTRHLGKVRYSSTVNDTQTPWGWKGNDKNARGHVPKTAAMNGTSGLDAYLNKHSDETSSSVGWPYREEKTEFAGKAYKVTRKTTSEKPRLRTTGNQPWGW